MTQGIFIQGKRPASKKAVREAIAVNLASVYIEGTGNAFHPGSEYDGPLASAPAGTTISFVGPDPFTKRNFYGTIRVHQGGVIKIT